MFTGLITDVGTVIARHVGSLRIRSRFPASSIAVGASIACDGCCLTAVRVDENGDGCVFAADVSNETLARTTIGSWEEGRAVNLERAVVAGGELGGHIVTGHVDGIAEIVAAEADGASMRFTLDAGAADLARFIAPKGSVALDGTSLTVNGVEGNRFGVNLIPHSLTATTWGRKKPGGLVHVEVDLVARYVARLLEFRP